MSSSNYYKSVTIDYETLGKTKDAHVIAFSICAFNIDDLESVEDIEARTLDVVLSEKGQEHRKVDPDTMKWWRDDIEREEILNSYLEDPNAITISRLFNEVLPGYLDIFTNSSLDCKWYCRGQDFDFPITESLLEDVGLQGNSFYKYYNTRDIRSFLSGLYADENFTEYKLDDDINNRLGKHNCKNDVIRNVLSLQSAYYEMVERP